MPDVPPQIDEPTPEEVAAQTSTSDDTIAWLLDRSKRKSRSVPIANAFLQQGRGAVRVPGPLHRFVQKHDERALDLYLLTHAVATKAPYDITEAAAVWARVLNLGPTTSAKTAVSKGFARLERLGLVSRDKDGKSARITLRADDGEGGVYVHPNKAGAQYLKLPYEYWTEHWHRRLELHAKAVLLIALSLPDGFPLPSEKAHPWYGISAKTFARGVSDLHANGLINVRKVPKKAPGSPEGVTIENRYTLRPPFGPRGELAKGAPPECRT
jgi:hypothetical protein